MNIGFVGLGAMGAPMAARLIGAGHGVTVHNRTKAKAEPLLDQGATWAETPAQAAAAGIVFTMLTNDAAAAEVCEGPDGIIAGLPDGGIHVSCSTISVEASASLTDAHERAGRCFVAATVLGRPPAAASGTLFVSVAGAAGPVARVRPLLEAIGQRVFDVGETPSMANLVKLSANFLLFSTIEQLAEVFAITAKAGVDRGRLFEFLTGSFFNAPVHKNYGKLIVDRAYDSKGTDIALALKDTGLMLKAAEALAAPMPLASLVHDKLLACAAHGERDQDFAVLAREAERGAGLMPAG
jgi:3-hydroxyisobutyrate dehydrogenase-like beta-hydroxyacid dehydrogenase